MSNYYPPPAENPKCVCYPNLLAAMFCMTGHMTECHYPMSCRDANCSHLDRYEGGPSEDEYMGEPEDRRGNGGPGRADRD